MAVQKSRLEPPEMNMMSNIELQEEVANLRAQNAQLLKQLLGYQVRQRLRLDWDTVLKINNAEVTVETLDEPKKKADDLKKPK